MNIKALKDYIEICIKKGTVPTIKGLKQFHKANEETYKIA